MTKRTVQDALIESMNEAFTDAFGGTNDEDTPEEVWGAVGSTLTAASGSVDLDGGRVPDRAEIGLLTHEGKAAGSPPVLHWERDRSLTDGEMGFDCGRPDGLYGLRGYRPDGAKWPVLTVAVWSDHRDPGAGFNVTCKWRRRAGERMELRSIPIELMGDVASLLADVDRDLHRSHRDGPG